MSDHSPELPFEAFDTGTWKARVEKELKGKTYDDFLLWNSLDGFSIEAWQNQPPANRPSLPALSTPWKIVEPVYEKDAQEANKRALDALMSGAEAVWFEKGFLGAAAEVATNTIDQSIAPVFVNEGSHVDPFRSVLKSNEEFTLNSESDALLNGVRLRERGATVIQEIALLLSQALEVLKSGGPEQGILFKIGMGENLLTEIAKVRALRWLWSSVQQSEGLPAQNPELLAVNVLHGYSINDEHTNILRATSSALAAAMGGAQYIMIEPWNYHFADDQSFSGRISRNIQVLMKEEGRLDKNLNPVDGSYFLENLTVAIAEKAWHLTQTIEQLGGFSEYARSGQLKNELQSSRDHQLAAYQTGEKILLGVNKFPPNEVKDIAQSDADSYALLPDYFSLPFELKSQQA